VRLGGGILGRHARLPAAVERDAVGPASAVWATPVSASAASVPQRFTAPPRQAWPTSAPAARCRTVRRARR
jgi:hypothetical protein